MKERCVLGTKLTEDEFPYHLPNLIIFIKFLLRRRSTEVRHDSCAEIKSLSSCSNTGKRIEIHDDDTHCLIVSNIELFTILINFLSLILKNKALKVFCLLFCDHIP